MYSKIKISYLDKSNLIILDVKNNIMYKIKIIIKG